MIYYNIFSAICIALLVAIAVYYIVKFFKKEHSKRVDFIRKFKKGNCAVVYMVAIPLYFMGHLYAGQGVPSAFFSAINKTMVLVVLRYDMSSISKLMEDSRLFTATVYLCFVLVAINAMLFILSFLHQRAWAWLQWLFWCGSRKEKLLIVGNNQESIDIYSSARKRAAMLVDDLSESEKTGLYAKQVRFVSKRSEIDDLKKKRNADKKELFSELEQYCNKLLLKCLSNPKKSCIIIINTKNDEKNIAICNKIISATREYFKDEDVYSVADKLKRIRVYVYGAPAYENVYNTIVETSNGCIRYINKYRQIAMDFANRYPLTQFMSEEQIDYQASLLKENVDVNVAMIGFGKTNQQIFLTSVANNQFLSQKDGKAILKPVNYHIFDKQYKENNKNLNHSYYRFKNEFAEEIKAQEKGGAEQPYLPFPALPANEEYDKLDINDSEFYKKIRTALCGQGRFNYIIIAFGTDLENIDMAQKMLEKKQEWGLENTFVFVKVRSGDDSHKIFKRDDCFVIGDENKVVYNIEKIDDNEITAMAKKRNEIYLLEYEITTSAKNDDTASLVEAVRAKAECDWYIKKTQFERESNLYACLSLRSKLHLMGMDYVNASSDKVQAQISESDYNACYSRDDEPISYDGILADGKRVIRYDDIDYKDSRRRTMAIHEHYRWNSFMISKGFVPASKEEIKNDKERNGKDYSLRRHGNLTTFEGLEEFRRIVSLSKNISESKADVIKYDYQLLDDAYWLLSKSNYKIVQREN